MRSPEARYVEASVGRTESRLLAHAANDGLLWQGWFGGDTSFLDGTDCVTPWAPAQDAKYATEALPARGWLCGEDQPSLITTWLLVRATSFVRPAACRLLLQRVITAAP